MNFTEKLDKKLVQAHLPQRYPDFQDIYLFIRESDPDRIAFQTLSG
jgi:hypothetical protein